MAMVHRYQWRVMSFALFMRNPYPPFDVRRHRRPIPGADPAVFSIEEPPELNRWLPLVKWLLAIPHYIVLAVPLHRGGRREDRRVLRGDLHRQVPEGLRNYVIGVFRWANRVCDLHLLHDRRLPAVQPAVGAAVVDFPRGGQ